MSLSHASDIFKKGINYKNYTTEDIAKRFNNTLYNLNEVLSVSNNKNGSPIYSVWIKFQLGEMKPILFDSQSNIYERNLIANLSISKGQNGYANTFTLEIYYDAFKNGQETEQSIAETLDEYVATAMSYDFDNDNTDMLKGYIQYGYNQLDDTDKQLYTPIYEFYLTDANSEVSYNSGITHYSFQGTSMISSDINFIANIEKQEDRPLTIVKNILTKYYGSEESGFDPPYIIDISDKLLNEQPTDKISIDAVNTNPLSYCKDILDQHQLNQAEIDSGEYSELKMSKTKEGQKPQYTLFITESDGIYTIHVNRVTAVTLGSNITLDYMFDWSNTNNNIVMSWKPNADLKFYIIQAAKEKRRQRLLQNSGNFSISDVANLIKKGIQDKSVSETVLGGVAGIVGLVSSTALNTINNESSNAKDDVIKEYYDATLECIGIPADAPIGGLVRIKPVLMQTVSRTAGIYFIKGAEDVISTNGTYKTILTLFRRDSIDNWDKYKFSTDTYTWTIEAEPENNLTTKDSKWYETAWNNILNKSESEDNNKTKWYETAWNNILKK